MSIRIPSWAPFPEPGERDTFYEYWLRQGVSRETLHLILDGLTPATEDVANERMATYVARTCPVAYLSHIRSIARNVR